MTGHIYASFWGRSWQDDEVQKAAAALIARQLSQRAGRALLQSTFFTDAGWYDGAASTAITPAALGRILQLMIDRGALADASEPDEAYALSLIIFLDASLCMKVDPLEAPPQGRFISLLGNAVRYGVISRERPEEAAGAALGLLSQWEASPPVATPATDPGHGLLPLPSLYLEKRVPRYRLDEAEIDTFLSRLALPIPIDEVPAAAAILRQAAALVEAKVVARAAKPTPASPAELSDFTRPNPRVTIAERFSALRGSSGVDLANVALLEKILSSVSETEFARLRALYFGNGAANFIDIVFWTFHKIKVAKSLGLDSGPPQSVWDIGCGGGHFAKVCQHFGHRVLGTDQEHPVYRDIAAGLGVERTISVLLAGQPTAPFGRKFDLVTAMAIEFNHHFPRTTPTRYWSLDHWKFLFNDLMANHLNYPARLYLDLNFETRDGRSVYHPELLALCARHGAAVDERRGIIDWRLGGPLSV